LGLQVCRAFDNAKHAFFVRLSDPREENPMSYTKLDFATFFQFVVRSWRKPLMLAWLVIATFSPGAAAQHGGSLTVQQLGDALSIYHKNTVNNNGNIYYGVSATEGKLKMDVVLSLSPNGRVIWIDSDIAPMPTPGRTSIAAMLNLLKKNNEIGPLFFSVNGNSLRLSYPVPNFNQTSESVKQYLQAFVSAAMDNAALWDSASLAGR
jgi:hypothetical protein